MGIKELWSGFFGTIAICTGATYIGYGIVYGNWLGYVGGGALAMMGASLIAWGKTE